MNKKSLIIIVVVFIGFVLFFLSYKIYFLHKYSTNEFEDSYQRFIDIIENKKEHYVHKVSLSKDQYLTYKNIKIKNIFSDYVLEYDSLYVQTYYLYDGDKKVSQISFSILNPIYESEIVVDNESLSAEDILKNHGLDNILILFDYLYQNKEKKPTVFTSNNEIKENYVIKSLLSNYDVSSHGKVLPKKIIYLVGDYTGYLLAYKLDDNRFLYEVHIFVGDKDYVLSFGNMNITENEILDLIDTLVIE